MAIHQRNLLDSLLLHIKMSASNFESNIDKLIDNTDNYSIKSEIIETECLVFCLCWLTIRLKILNKIQNEKEAKLIVKIGSDLLGIFIKEYKTEENILFKNSLYIESLRDLLNIFLKRYDIYESKMVKGIDYFIESFITIINYDLSHLTIAKRIPILKNKNNIFIGSSELFIKTMKNIDKTIEFFFNDGIELFYNNINNQKIIKYYWDNIDNKIKEYLL